MSLEFGARITKNKIKLFSFFPPRYKYFFLFCFCTSQEYNVAYDSTAEMQMKIKRLFIDEHE